MIKLTNLVTAAMILGTPSLTNYSPAHNPVVYHTHVAPHYRPGEPVRNTLKFLFCPRCHRQYPIGTVCSCSTHTHVNHYINPASQTRTEVIIRQVSPTAVHREIYFSLP